MPFFIKNILGETIRVIAFIFPQPNSLLQGYLNDENNNFQEGVWFEVDNFRFPKQGLDYSHEGKKLGLEK